MNFLAQQNHGFDLLRDESRSKEKWPITLFKELLNQGNQKTADLLPEELVSILRDSKTIDLVIATTEYGIEAAAGFVLTDFSEATGLKVSDGTTMRWAHKIDPDLADETSPYLKGNKHEPTYFIGPHSSTAGERSIYIRPAPAANVVNGLTLPYKCLVPTLTADGDISVLPVNFHQLPVWYAVSLMLAKEQIDPLGKGLQNAMRYWVFWRDSLLAANAKYNRGVEIPALTEEAKGK